MTEKNMTRGQRAALRRLCKLYGKMYSESSLVAEMRRILPIEKWVTKGDGKQLVVQSEHLGLDFSLKFEKPTRKTYRLTAIAV